jgi:mRNA-degrading endonuclease RelE of RelBE toxin-antitoxin system
MKIDYTRTALEAVEGAPVAVRKAFWKQMKFLEQNLLHPGLHAKKYSEAANTWQGRVNKDWRFYFTIVGGTIIIQDITPHPK